MKKINYRHRFDLSQHMHMKLMDKYDKKTYNPNISSKMYWKFLGKRNYHLHCFEAQQTSNRILTENEKKNIYNSSCDENEVHSRPWWLDGYTRKK